MASMPPGQAHGPSEALSSAEGSRLEMNKLIFELVASHMKSEGRTVCAREQRGEQEAPRASRAHAARAAQRAQDPSGPTACGVRAHSTPGRLGVWHLRRVGTSGRPRSLQTRKAGSKKVLENTPDRGTRRHVASDSRHFPVSASGSR